MKEEKNFFLPTLIEDIKCQLRDNTKSIKLYGTVSNLPLVALFKTPINNIQNAFEAFQQNLEREQIAINRLIRESGEDTLPSQIFVTELDGLALLAISEDRLYLLDRRIYTINKEGRWIDDVKKVVNGKITAVYA